jgi:hypothetical protein
MLQIWFGSSTATSRACSGPALVERLRSRDCSSKSGVSAVMVGLPQALTPQGRVFSMWSGIQGIGNGCGDAGHPDPRSPVHRCHAHVGSPHRWQHRQDAAGSSLTGKSAAESRHTLPRCRITVHLSGTERPFMIPHAATPPAPRIPAFSVRLPCRGIVPIPSSFVTMSWIRSLHHRNSPPRKIVGYCPADADGNPAGARERKGAG